MKQFLVRLTCQLADENRQGNDQNHPVDRLAKRPANPFLDAPRGDNNSRHNSFINHSVFAQFDSVRLAQSPSQHYR
jgi:hypothetical protein